LEFLSEDPAAPVLVCQVWRVRVYGERHRPFLELTWDLGAWLPRLTMRGLENSQDKPEPRKAEVDAAWASRQLLYTALRRGGRRERGGETLPTRDSFVAACHAMYAKVDRQGWQYRLQAATDEWLAQQLGCSTSTLYGRLADYRAQGTPITLDD